MLAQYQGPLPLHAGRRVPGHQRGPVPLAAAPRPGASQPLLRGRRRPVDLRLARRRGRQHPAFRARLPGRRHRQAREQLPLDRPHPRGRLGADRPERGPARQDALHRRRGGRAPPRLGRLGFGGGGAPGRRGDRAAPPPEAFARRDRHPGPRLVPDAGVRGALHHPGPALPRHRRPALLRAAGDPRRAGLPPLRRPARRRPRLRADHQHAEARPRGFDDRHPAGLRPCPRPAADRLGRHDGGDGRAEAEAAPDAEGAAVRFRPLADAGRHHPAFGTRRAHP